MPSVTLVILRSWPTTVARGGRSSEGLRCRRLVRENRPFSPRRTFPLRSRCAGSFKSSDAIRAARGREMLRGVSSDFCALTLFLFRWSKSFV